MTMKKTKKKAIILLSGGLDSIVSAACVIENSVDIALALTFNYGQKSFEKEFTASKQIASYYNIEHKCITLDWLKDITNTALVSQENVPEVDTKILDDISITTDSMKNVWVPNRNGLFINIAAAYADSLGIDYIVIGANKEEASTFSDNSKKFINDMNKVLETSTNKDVKVLAPLIDYEKKEIIKKAVELNVPLKFINSCYNNTKKHCGKCESCNRLKRALINTKNTELITELFE